MTEIIQRNALAEKGNQDKLLEAFCNDKETDFLRVKYNDFWHDLIKIRTYTRIFKLNGNIEVEVNFETL